MESGPRAVADRSRICRGVAVAIEILRLLSLRVVVLED